MKRFKLVGTSNRGMSRFSDKGKGQAAFRTVYAPCWQVAVDTANQDTTVDWNKIYDQDGNLIRVCFAFEWLLPEDAAARQAALDLDCPF